LNGLDVFYIGHDAQLNYEKEVLGDSLDALQAVAEGTSPYCEILESAQQPLLILGMSTLFEGHYQGTMSLVKRLVERYPMLLQPDWNGVCFLQTRAGRNGGLDIGFVSNKELEVDRIKFLYAMGGDEWPYWKHVPKDAFVIYQGSHGDRGARRADVVLPGCSWAEKNGTFVNIDGRVQRSKAALTPPGQARNDWQIIRALAEVCGVELGYDGIEGLRDRMFEVAPHLESVDRIESNEFNLYSDEVEASQTDTASKAVVPITSEKLQKYFTNYFATDPISRSSLVLKKASKDLPNSTNSWC